MVDLYYFVGLIFADASTHACFFFADLILRLGNHLQKLNPSKISHSAVVEILWVDLYGKYVGSTRTDQYSWQRE